MATTGLVRLVAAPSQEQELKKLDESKASSDYRVANKSSDRQSTGDRLRDAKVKAEDEEKARHQKVMSMTRASVHADLLGSKRSAEVIKMQPSNNHHRKQKPVMD